MSEKPKFEPWERNPDDVDAAMNTVQRNWRYRWCEAQGGCACMGCANMSGQMVPKGFNKTDWLGWVQRHDRRRRPRRLRVDRRVPPSGSEG